MCFLLQPSASDNGSDNDSDGDSGEEQTEQRNESGAETSEPAGDSEYELSREEPQSPSAQEWKVILMKAEFAEVGYFDCETVEVSIPRTYL